MYLVEIDPVDGLVKVDGSYDGIRAIKEFREIINDKELGRECMTAIALVADWLTPIRYYSEEDRPKKAMHDVANDRNAFIWKQEKIQVALNKYKDLQYNPNLVEKERLDEMQMLKLEQIKKEKSSTKQVTLFQQLNVIKGLIEAWNKSNEDSNPYAEGPVENGYLLSRLEEKLNDRHSFYNAQKN